MRKSGKKPVHYVDNQRLLKEMISYKEKVNLWKDNGKNGTKPKVPTFVADSLIKIATNLSTVSGFVGYPFREDMIGDAVLNCLEYIDNFNPEKYNNPFSYFTQIIYFAFIRRIKKEQKVVQIKVKSFEKLVLELELEGHSSELSNVKSTLSATKDKIQVG